MEIPVSQRSAEWFALRRNYFTASEIDALLIGGKTRASYIEKKVNEYLGIEGRSFTTEWMQRGVDYEAEAREAFGRDTFSIVRECGFFVSEYYQGIGGSPDGFIDRTKETVEIKIPTPNRFVQYRSIRCGGDLLCAERKYYTQMQTCMFLTQSKAGYFVAYCPEAAPGSRLHWARIERDDKYIGVILVELEKARNERDDILKNLGIVPEYNLKTKEQC